ncbi:MAG: hypothetical protein ACQERD_00350 [Campylobacterota bacterium]
MNKKAFSLMITLLLVSIFSFLSINILQTKAFSNKTLELKYLYIQAKNHKDFLKSYIKTLKKSKLETVEKITLDDSFFNIEAFLNKKDSKFLVDIFIKSKNHNVSLHDSFILE